MKLYDVLVASITVFVVARMAIAGPQTDESPADHLPPFISQLTAFGERADWSANGKRILFLSKTFGDAMEIDLGTRAIRNLTAFYPHLGYTRACTWPTATSFFPAQSRSIRSTLARRATSAFCICWIKA